MSAAFQFLVTAGNTRERIDSVRDWGNIFTGNTGFTIAKALAAVGEVDLLTSNRVHIEEAKSLELAHSVRATGFTTHHELRGLLAALVTRHRYDAIFMTAAVADYHPARTYEVVERKASPVDGTETWVVRDAQAAKIKSTHAEIAVLGKRTEKLVDLFRTEWGFTGTLVKFKLEVGIGREQLLTAGDASRRASRADFLIANTLEMVSGENAGAFLMSDLEPEWVPRAELAGRLVKLVTQAPAR